MILIRIKNYETDKRDGMNAFHICGLLFALVLFSSCNKKGDDKIMSCSFYEEHFGSGSNSTYTIGQKAAQRFIVTSSATIKAITLEMDLLNSQTVTLSLYRENSGNTTPANNVLLAQTTITSSHVANSGKIEFKLSSSSVVSGNDYYFVLESTGGSFEMTKQTTSIFDLYGEVWKYNSSAWTSDQNYDFSFSITGGC
jgi:hypothetical protein